jgi:DHA1 family bicyclomycin/chloramphenicol resistance-like MFS transporter
MHPAQRASLAAPPIILLGIASGLSPFGVTIAVPILADLARQFSAGYGQVQWLVSIYLFGLALAQPFNGFLCDRFGRRPVMLSGFSLFVLASVAAAFTTSLNALILLRLLQAMGVSVGTVASRAVVRDTHDERGSTVALSYIAATMGFAPILAPVIGGWLGDHGGYTSVFLVTALLGAFILATMWRSLPETLNPAHARPRWADWMRNYARLFRSPMFMAHSLIFGFKQGSFFAFLGVGAVVFETHFGIGQGDFGLLWGLMAFTYVAGAIISARLIRRFDPRPIMHVAILATLAGGWGIVADVWLPGPDDDRGGHRDAGGPGRRRQPSPGNCRHGFRDVQRHRPRGRRFLHGDLRVCLRRRVHARGLPDRRRGHALRPVLAVGLPAPGLAWAPTRPASC